jgi:hypothetical protein
VEYEYRGVNLLAGEQLKPEFAKLSPMKEVPLLLVDGHGIGQSAAILEYLEEAYPSHPLLPRDPGQLPFRLAACVCPRSSRLVLWLFQCSAQKLASSHKSSSRTRNPFRTCETSCGAPCSIALKPNRNRRVLNMVQAKTGQEKDKTEWGKEQLAWRSACLSIVKWV